MVPFYVKALKRCGLKASNEKALKAWRSTVAAHARVAGERPREPLREPVAVELRFQFERPKNHYHQRKAGPVLRADAPVWCDTITTGDLDKLTRACFDALTMAGWYDDDTRVVESHQWAWWGDWNACSILLREPVSPIRA